MTFPPLAIDRSKPYADRLRIWAGSRGPALRKAVGFKEDKYAPGSSGWHAIGAARGPEKLGYGLWWQAKVDSLAPEAINPLGNDLRVALAPIERARGCVLVPWDAGRVLERHVELLLRGTSWTITSRHLVGVALDIVLYVPGYGPSEKETKAFVLHEGALARVIDQTDEWYYIFLQDKNNGWVLKKSCEIV